MTFTAVVYSSTRTHTRRVHYYTTSHVMYQSNFNHRSATPNTYTVQVYTVFHTQYYILYVYTRYLWVINFCRRRVVYIGIGVHFIPGSDNIASCVVYIYTHTHKNAKKVKCVYKYYCVLSKRITFSQEEELRVGFIEASPPLYTVATVTTRPIYIYIYA